MESFKLINVRDVKTLNKYINDSSWKRSVLLPYYREGYICFSRNKDYSFEELSNLFFHGNESDQIGAISVIAERFPYELYIFLCDSNHDIPSKKLNYLLELVIPSYLPLYLPKEKLKNYNFNGDFSDDIWVNILTVIRTRI